MKISIKETSLFIEFTMNLIGIFISRYNYHKMVYHDNHDIRYIVPSLQASDEP